MRYIILLAFCITAVSCQDNSSQKEHDEKVQQLEEKISDLEKKLEEKKDAEEQSTNYYQSKNNEVDKSIPLNGSYSPCKYLFGKVKMKSITQLIGTRKRLIPDDPNSPMGSDETSESDYYLITEIQTIKNYSEDKKYKFKDAVRRAAMNDKRGDAIITSYEIKDIQIYEFDDYATASKSREALSIKNEISIFEHF